MTYYIQQLSSTSNGVDYWTYILDTNGNEYSTTDVVELEVKLKELYKSFGEDKILVVSRHTVTNDLSIS
jgi:hypothetical protein